MDFEGTGRLANLDHVALVLIDIPTECFVPKGSSGNPSDEQLVTDPVSIKYASDVILERIGVDT